MARPLPGGSPGGYPHHATDRPEVPTVDNSSYSTVTAVCGIGIGLALFAARRPVGRLLDAGLER